MAKRTKKGRYSFWLGRLNEDGLELWMEFFEPRLALAWKRQHFPGETDVVCVEHHESGKLSSSVRKTISYWPEWATGDNWRRVCDDTVRHFDLLLDSRAKKAQKARETRFLTELTEKRRALELAEAKEEAYGMAQAEHEELTARVGNEED